MAIQVSKISLSGPVRDWTNETVANFTFVDPDGWIFSIRDDYETAVKNAIKAYECDKDTSYAQLQVTRD